MDFWRAGRRDQPRWVVVTLVALVVGLSGAYGPAASVASAAPGAGSAASSPKLLDLPVDPRVLLIGDSYTEGWGAEPMSKGFAQQVAAPLRWQLTRDGVGRTGYMKIGIEKQGTYPQRLWAHPADAYDLVVLQGGSNDEKFSEADITKAVELTFRTVRHRYPHARLLVMGPISPYGTSYPNRAKLIRVLATVTSQHNVLFIDPSAEHWFVKGDEATLVNAAKGHPNNAGYARIAKLFVHDVQAMSVPAHPLTADVGGRVGR